MCGWCRKLPYLAVTAWLDYQLLNGSITMADHQTCPPLTRQSVQKAHERIKPYVYETPVATCTTLNVLASTPQKERCPNSGPNTAAEPAPHTSSQGEAASSYTANPEVRLFFKCENQQRIGAFKARGAFHALGRLIEEQGIESVRKKGVCTHSSGMVSYSTYTTQPESDPFPLH
jgi:threonine dehydratase